MGNDCCAERPDDEDMKTKDIDVLADDGMTPDISYRTRRQLPVKVKYWEDFEPVAKRNSLKSILDDWPENGMKVLNDKFIEIQGRRQDQGEDVVPPGMVWWDGGDVREIVRMLFENWGLPIPACSVQVWTCYWHRYEHDKKTYVNMVDVIEFGKFFCQNLLVLATGDSVKVEVAPNVFVASDESVKKGDWQKDFVKHIPAMKKVLEDWDDDHEHETMDDFFSSADKDGGGKLTWNDGEVKAFIMAVFKEHKIPLPNLTEMQWYNLYRKFSTNMNKAHGMGLNHEEAEEFARFVHQEIVVEERVAVDEMGDGVVDAPPAVTLKALQGKPLSTMPGEHKQLAQAKLDNWDSKTVQQAYQETSGGKPLQWNGNGIVNFVCKVFEKNNWPKPRVDQSAWHSWWMEFDHDHHAVLEPQEAMQFVKFMIERIMHLNGEQIPGRPVAQVRAEQRGVVLHAQPAMYVMPGQQVLPVATATPIMQVPRSAPTVMTRQAVVQPVRYARR